MEEDPGGRIADDAGDVTERVRQVITRLGCSHREFARRIVMDPSKLSRSLGGTRRSALAEIVRIADIGGVDTGWLLGAPERPAAPPEHGPATVPEGGRPLPRPSPSFVRSSRRTGSTTTATSARRTTSWSSASRPTP